MEYVPEDFLGKSFEELQDVLVVKEYDYSFIKNNISNPYFRFDTFISEGKLNVLGVEIDSSIISFMANKCFSIIALISTEQAIKITLLLKDFFPNKFRFISKEDVLEFDKIATSKHLKGEFTEFEIKHLEFDISKKFDFHNFENYSSISAFLNDYSVIIAPKAQQYLLTIFPLKSIHE